MTGSLSTVRGARDLAEQVNRLRRFNTVIHNAGIGYREPKRVETEDALPEVFATTMRQDGANVGLRLPRSLHSQWQSG